MKFRHIIVCTCGIVLCLLGCRPSEKYRTLFGSNHTYYRIVYKSSRSLDTEIKAAFASYYHSLNPFDSLSIITAVNRNSSMEVDSLFAGAFRSAEYVALQTDGMFDVTCAPLINLWGFGFEKYDSVSPAMVDSMLSFTGFKKVRLEGGKIIKEDPRVTLNFSGLGDGYICDIIGRMLGRNGVTDYLVDVGGEILTKGKNPDGRYWRIGINKPVDDSTCTVNEIQRIVELRDCGMATSGDYRNYYLKDGKKYAHTINPKTGYPAGQDILSATVIATETTIADAFATAFMALGREKSRSLADKHPELEYYFICRDSLGNFAVECSEGMKARLIPE